LNEEGKSMADIPNYLSLIIEVIAIPAIILLWQARTKCSIPGLEVSLGKGQGFVNGQNVSFLKFTFTNRTREVVYIRNARIRLAKSEKSTCQLPQTHLAQRDIATFYHPLKFLGSNAYYYDEHEVILHDTHEVETVLPMSAEPHDDVLAYSRRWCLARPCYFTLQYTAVVGDRLFKVVSKY
jgi:hypothetical protein